MSFSILSKGDVFVVVVSDYDLRVNRVVSVGAIDLFYKLNHIVLENNVDCSLEITLDQIMKMLGCSRSVALRYKNELVDKGFMIQDKVIPNRCVYTLEVFSYDLLAGFIMKKVSKNDLPYKIAEEVREQSPDLFWLACARCSDEEVITEEIETEMVEEPQKVIELVGAVSNGKGNYRIPKPVRNTGRLSSETYEDNPKAKLRSHPFIDFKKPIAKWTAKDFVDYYCTNYSQKYGEHAPISKIALPTMAREYRRIGKESLKEQIKVFFTLCESNRYAPTWETFASANVQQKLDHYRKTGEIVGFGGRIQDKNAKEIRAERLKKEKIHGSYDDLGNIGNMLMAYESRGKAIFDDPEKGDWYLEMLDLAAEKGYALHKQYKVQTKTLVKTLKELGRYKDGEKDA